MAKPKGFFWYDASNADKPVFHRYIKDRPVDGRVYFGDVYRREGIGDVMSRIYRTAGDILTPHKSIAEAKAFIEAEGAWVR